MLKGAVWRVGTVVQIPLAFALLIIFLLRFVRVHWFAGGVIQLFIFSTLEPFRDFIDMLHSPFFLFAWFNVSNAPCAYTTIFVCHVFAISLAQEIILLKIKSRLYSRKQVKSNMQKRALGPKKMIPSTCNGYASMIFRGYQEKQCRQRCCV